VSVASFTNFHEQNALDFAGGSTTITSKTYTSGRLYIIALDLFNIASSGDWSAISISNGSGVTGTWTKLANTYQAQGILRFWSKDVSGTGTLSFNRGTSSTGYNCNIGESTGGFDTSNPIVASSDVDSSSTTPTVPALASAGNVTYGHVLSSGTNSIAAWTQYYSLNFAGFLCNDYNGTTSNPTVTSSDLKRFTSIQIAEASAAAASGMAEFSTSMRRQRSVYARYRR
jgi:hypothetical protein